MHSQQKYITSGTEVMFIPSIFTRARIKKANPV
jgi:hypothetical protein